MKTGDTGTVTRALSDPASLCASALPVLAAFSSRDADVVPSMLKDDPTAENEVRDSQKTAQEV